MLCRAIERNRWFRLVRPRDCIIFCAVKALLWPQLILKSKVFRLGGITEAEQIGARPGGSSLGQQQVQSGKGGSMRRNCLLLTFLSVATFCGAVRLANAEETVKIGLILPMTGPFSSTGKQISAAVKLFIQENGDTVAGKKIEVILKDDTGSAEITKRLAQELVVNDKVAFLAGFGLTPLALATAPIATQAKVPEIVTAAATSSITEASPFIVRTSFTLPQACVPMAQWAAAHCIKNVVTIVSDYGPGLDAEKWFTAEFAKRGGKTENIRVPVRNPDFSPFLQKAADEKPDAIFVFVPSGVGSVFMKQFRERGLDKSGIKLIGSGDVTDDDILNEIGDAALGATTSHHYSAAHDSPEKDRKST